MKSVQATGTPQSTQMRRAEPTLTGIVTGRLSAEMDDFVIQGFSMGTEWVIPADDRIKNLLEQAMTSDRRVIVNGTRTPDGRAFSAESVTFAR